MDALYVTHCTWCTVRDALYVMQYSLKCLADSWGPSLSWALVTQWRSSWQKARWWDYRVAGGSRMPARNTSGRPGTRLPLSSFAPCWSHAQSHVWGRTERAPDKNRTSLWNGPGYGRSQYETAERVKMCLSAEQLRLCDTHRNMQSLCC